MKIKALKIFGIILMLMVLVMTSTPIAFAADGTKAEELLEKIEPNTDDIETEGLTNTAGKILGLVQLVSAIAAVVLVAIFGFKFIMGSANEKADYQKSFIPLIVGIAVVFAASSIAKLLFSTFGNIL